MPTHKWYLLTGNTRELEWNPFTLWLWYDLEIDDNGTFNFTDNVITEIMPIQYSLVLKYNFNMNRV